MATKKKKPTIEQRLTDLERSHEFACAHIRNVWQHVQGKVEPRMSEIAATNDRHRKVIEGINGHIAKLFNRMELDTMPKLRVLDDAVQALREDFSHALPSLSDSAKIASTQRDHDAQIDTLKKAVDMAIQIANEGIARHDKCILELHDKIKGMQKSGTDQPQCACPDCNGLGYLTIQPDEDTVRVWKCDACNRFADHLVAAKAYSNSHKGAWATFVSFLILRK